MNLKRLDWILCKVQESATLTPRELKFIDDMTNRRERFGDRITVTEAQEEWLERISEKD